MPITLCENKHQPLLHHIYSFLLARATLGFRTSFRKVRAHTGVIGNERTPFLLVWVSPPLPLSSSCAVCMFTLFAPPIKLSVCAVVLNTLNAPLPLFVPHIPHRELQHKATEGKKVKSLESLTKMRGCRKLRLGKEPEQMGDL